MSDASATVPCPVCGIPGVPGEFCMMGCGRIPRAEGGAGMAPTAAPAPSAAPSGPLREGAPGEAGWGSTPCGTGPHEEAHPQGAALSVRRGARVEGLAPAPASVSFAETSGTEPDASPMPGVAVECSPPATMQEGRTDAFLFRVRAPGDVERVLVRLSDPVLGGLCEPVEPKAAPGFGWSEIPLNHRPARHGAIEAEVRVECRRFGALEWEAFTAPLSIVIAPPPSQAGIVVNADRAARVVVSAPAAAVAAVSAPNPRRFRRMALRQVSGPRRLSLLAGGERLHLVGGDAHFGRSKAKPSKGRTRDNDVVLHRFLSDGSPDSAPTRTISRTHFSLSFDGREWRLTDGGPARDESGNLRSGGPIEPSRFGTEADGAALRPGGSVVLRAGAPHRIVLAASAVPGGALALHAETLPDASGAPFCAGVLVRREDGVSESYLVLRRGGVVDLGAAFPARAGLSVAWDGACLRAGAGGAALASGPFPGAPAGALSVAPFRQLNL